MPDDIGQFYMSGELDRYCAPGPWKANHLPDDKDGNDIWLTYEPVSSCLDIEAMTFDEHSLAAGGSTYLRHFSVGTSGVVPATLGEFDIEDEEAANFVALDAVNIEDEDSDDDRRKIYAHVPIDKEGVEIGGWYILEQDGEFDAFHDEDPIEIPILWRGNVVWSDGNLLKRQ